MGNDVVIYFQLSQLCLSHLRCFPVLVFKEMSESSSVNFAQIPRLDKNVSWLFALETQILHFLLMQFRNFNNLRSFEPTTALMDNWNRAKLNNFVCRRCPRSVLRPAPIVRIRRLPTRVQLPLLGRLRGQVTSYSSRFHFELKVAFWHFWKYGYNINIL